MRRLRFRMCRSLTATLRRPAAFAGGGKRPPTSAGDSCRCSSAGRVSVPSSVSGPPAQWASHTHQAARTVPGRHSSGWCTTATPCGRREGGALCPDPCDGPARGRAAWPTWCGSSTTSGTCDGTRRSRDRCRLFDRRPIHMLDGADHRHRTAMSCPCSPTHTASPGWDDQIAVTWNRAITTSGDDNRAQPGRW